MPAAPWSRDCGRSHADRFPGNEQPCLPRRDAKSTCDPLVHGLNGGLLVHVCLQEQRETGGHLQATDRATQHQQPNPALLISVHAFTSVGQPSQLLDFIWRGSICCRGAETLAPTAVTQRWIGGSEEETVRLTVRSLRTGA